MTREELREKVAMVIADAEYPGLNPVGVHKDMADAAIVLCMEEAAKEAERWVQFHVDDGGVLHISNITSTISAAIRALGGKDGH